MEISGDLPLERFQESDALWDLFQRGRGLVFDKVVLHTDLLSRAENGGPVHLAAAEMDIIFHIGLA